jgi:exopolyphosphatase/guanosine-5'-triphosphate,3'-diphosphate pyrophosphatase
VLAELQDIQSIYRRTGWQTAVGSSGTVRSAAAICQANGWCENKITREALKKLRLKALSFKTTAEIAIEGLSERRQPVFIGGLAILLACFEALEVSELQISQFALREGLLSDMLGRLEHRDPRDKAVRALMSRFGVDSGQAARVRTTALDLFNQLQPSHGLGEAYRELLGWAAELHEIGLGLSHESYQIHSAYLVEASDMAGFSRQEQLFLAALAGFQRRDIPKDFSAKLPRRLSIILPVPLLCMRLAWIFCRTREDSAIPDIEISMYDSRVLLTLSEDWNKHHPLTIADLEYEEQALQTTGLQLEIKYTDHESA